MTIETQQLPVAAVRRIVVVVVILMVDRQFTKSLPCEFAAAPGTDPGKELKCPLTIALLPALSLAAGLSNDLILLAGLCSPFIR
jgi:hypothetical protein